MSAAQATNFQQTQQTNNTKNKSSKFDPRLVPSGKVYRQLFEAQVQLTNAYDKVKEKYKENPPQVKLDDNSIPIVTEPRSLRGNGTLSPNGLEWINALPFENKIHNPVYLKHLSDMNKVSTKKINKLQDKETVFNLPEEVVPGSKGSDIEARIEASRKKKHNETWEDMIQEIGLINLNIEPEIRSIGKRVLDQLEQNDKEILILLEELKTDDIILNGSTEKFNNLKQKLLDHTDIRHEFIDEMDRAYLRLEDQRVDNIRSIFNKYAEKLFKISFLPRPKLERLLDDEIQQLNSQILANKTCYAQLYAKLITSDIERERNQIEQIDFRLNDWRSHALKCEIKNLENYVENLNMLNPDREKNNQEEDLEREQKEINEIRLGQIESLKSLKPPESSKSFVYKWFETFRLNTLRLQNINTNYVNKLQMNYEESNQKIINKMEETLEYLIQNQIINELNSKFILEHDLLPIWSKKQKIIEEHIQNVESQLEEINQILEKELNSLFKYLQSISHIWDLHEIGLVKKERALQEILQDSRKDHDNDNQKREEKLDSILDQMRESSNEKDLKRLLGYVSNQLDVIKNGYLEFKDIQLEIVKHYPEMVKEELTKYEDTLLKFYSLRPQSKQDSIKKEEKSTEEFDSFRDVLKEVLSTERGTRFYIQMRSSNIGPATTEESNLDNDEQEQNDILNHDELIPNTKHEILKDIENKNYLKNSYIPLELFKETKNLIRMNFLNHLETWKDEAFFRASTIVAAKCDEIEKEFDLRLHLHEPRIKRVEKDIHNVRAAELIMHEERVVRHCAGIEEAIENMHKQFAQLQTSLVDKANQNKSDVLNLELLFNNATKSLRLVHLQDELNRQRDKHIDDVKTTLRNFRAKFDDTLSFLRNSNAKFRFSFNSFIDGGNFSAEEIDLHKKKLEKMAILIDTNETNLLKEMEKLEKKHLDEAIKVMSQFQDRFKYNLIDIQFIEKISRWLSDTQIKIKTCVNESNAQAKNLMKLIDNFEIKIDACKHPNLDKIDVLPKDLIDNYEEIIKLIYERALYLKCIKDENMVPLQFRRNNSNQDLNENSTTKLVQLAQAIINEEPEHTKPSNQSNKKTTADQQQQQQQQSNTPVPLRSKSNVILNSNILRSGSKIAISDDPALEIMKNILNKNNQSENNKLSEAKEIAQSIAEQSTTQKSQTTTNGNKKQSKNSRSSKLSKSSISSKRAKTRDEMYAYYLTFGEHRNPGNHFIAKITNILREALEGILTNSEIFYRDLQQQNRPITRRASLKESYPEFAEAIISKLKSYLSQCEVYQNQCLKEFRESVFKFEIFISRVPELVIEEIYEKNKDLIEKELINVKKQNMNKLNSIDSERKKNETSLRPTLGHPNMQSKLDSLNEIELKRQEVNSNSIKSYTTELYSKIRECSDKYLKELSKMNENLLIKFDDILTVDDIKKYEIIAEKHKTSELIRRQLAGQSLEDPEPAPLIKREKGRWKGIDNYDIFKNDKDNKKSLANLGSSINTAKTTLAHKTCSDNSQIFYKKFEKIVENNLNDVKQIENDLKSNETKWKFYWTNSINEIKNLYK